MAGGRKFVTCETRIGRILVLCGIFATAAYLSYNLILAVEVYGQGNGGLHPHASLQDAKMLQISASDTLHLDHHVHHVHHIQKSAELKVDPKSPPPPSPPPPSSPPPSPPPHPSPAQEASGTDGGSGNKPTIHTLCTSNGSPYLNWQTRMMYYTYKKVAAMPGAEHMKYFTRLLHRRADDDLMYEVPTVRVDSLHPSCDTWCEFPVADRPNALRKWLETDDSKLGDWILMIETDYVWRQPVPVPPPGQTYAVCFEFGYINPAHPHVSDVMKALYDGSPEDIPRTGPAPTMIRRDDLYIMAGCSDPTKLSKYEEITEEIEMNKEYKNKLGWVREMYAYSLAAAVLGIKHECKQGPTNILMAQPPADHVLGQSAFYHYTWGARFMNSKGNVDWEWDKRGYVDTSHVRKPAQRRPALPPKNTVEVGLTLDGQVVSQDLYDTMTDMLGEMNEALNTLPNLKGCGWTRERPCTFHCQQGELCHPTETNLA